MAKPYKTFNDIVKNSSSPLGRLYGQAANIATTTKLIRKYLPTEFARYCTVAKVRGDVLFIRFSNSSINSKFRFYAAEVIAQIKKFPEFTQINKLKHGYIQKSEQPAFKPTKNITKTKNPALSAIIATMLENLRK